MDESALNPPGQLDPLYYETLFVHVPDGILIASAEGRYLDANPSICSMLGYTRDELVGRNAADIVAPGERQYIDPALSAIRTQAGYQREWQFRCKDGSDFSAEVSVTTLPDGNLLAVVRDVSERRQAEQEAKRLAAIVESSDDAIIGQDMNGVVTSWNRGAEKLFGYLAHEMIGTSLIRLIPDQRQAEEQRFLQRLRHGDRLSQFETQRRTRNGDIIDVALTVSAIRDADGTIVGVSKILRDITLLKTNEREIVRMSQLYSALSQVNQAIVVATTREVLLQKVCDALTRQGGFQMAWIGWQQPGTVRLMPIAVSGDESSYVDSIRIYTDDRPEGRGPTGTAFRTGRAYICNDMQNDPCTEPWRAEIERRGFRASAMFPIVEHSQVRGTLSVYADQCNFFQRMEIELLEEAASDISFALDNFAREDARRQAEQAAQNERDFSATMIESMPGILYFYTEAGQFLRWNRNFETVSGYAADEIRRMHPLDFFALPDREKLSLRIADVFDAGDAFIEAPFRSKDGRSTPYYFTGRRVVYDGTPCLVGMGIDIAERLRAETALRELNDTLEHKVAQRTDEMLAALQRAEAADKLKSAFLATMSHELRTPLNSIIGFTGILLQQLAGPLNDEQAKQLGMVQGSARHLLELINDVLDISKIEADQLEVRAESFDLHRSLERVLASVRPLAEKKSLALKAQWGVLPVDMQSDRRRIEQILINLLNNAIKFTERGEVGLDVETVTMDCGDPDAVARVAVRFRVSDSGIGIARDDLAKLFQPFRQIDSGLSRQHEGTGLGLAICRRLARLLQGEIAVESVWSQGSVFTVTIPQRMQPSDSIEGDQAGPATTGVEPGRNTP